MWACATYNANGDCLETGTIHGKALHTYIPIHVLHVLSAVWSEVVVLWSNGHYTGGVNLSVAFLHTRHTMIII